LVPSEANPVYPLGTNVRLVDIDLSHVSATVVVGDNRNMADLVVGDRVAMDSLNSFTTGERTP